MWSPCRRASRTTGTTGAQARTGTSATWLGATWSRARTSDENAPVTCAPRVAVPLSVGLPPQALGLAPPQASPTLLAACFFGAACLEWGNLQRFDLLAHPPRATP